MSIKYEASYGVMKIHEVTQGRDFRLDFLRFIGLSAVILAHVYPPDFIMQLRTFDVPLMVIISGVAFSITGTIKYRIVDYYKQRLLRLLLPTWLFLTVYFLYFGMADSIIDSRYVTLKLILNSFLLLNEGGIGYIWIVRVFILVAVSAPIVHYVNNRIQSTFFYLIFIIILFVIYFHISDIFTTNFVDKTDLFCIFISNYILYLIPYSLLFSIGLRLPKLSVQDIIIFLILLSVSFLFIAINIGNEAFSKINEYKYPPQALWTCYGALFSIFLYAITSKINLKHRLQKLICFLSASSLWIYLWHIFLLKNWDFGISHIPNCAKNSFFKFVIIFTLASAITYAQKKIIYGTLRKYKIDGPFGKIVAVGFLK